MRLDELKRIGAALYLRKGFPSYNEAYDHASNVVDCCNETDFPDLDKMDEEEAESFFYEVDISYWEE